MTVVMQISTDLDIDATQLHQEWHPITNRYTWAQVEKMNLNIAGSTTIVVIAHGNEEEIGNADRGMVDIDAWTFLTLIQGNMKNNAAPTAIYISTCGTGIAQYAASVRLAAESNQIWNNTAIFGHSDPVTGSVPPPNDNRWFEIYSIQTRCTVRRSTGQIDKYSTQGICMCTGGDRFLWPRRSIESATPAAPRR